MPRSASSLLVLLALPLASACAQGSDDPGMTSLSGAYSADNGAGDSTGSDSNTSGQDNSDSDPTLPGGTGGQDSSGGGDGGSPACCMVSPEPGCGSMQTESCVCSSMPSCCQQVWGADCVELAVDCGDPNCTGDSAGDSTGNDTDPGNLECDGAFAFSPGNPAADVAFDATFTDPIGLTYVGMRAEGPAGEMVEGTWGGVVGSGPFTWTYGFDGMAAGVWTFLFTHRETENGPDLVRGTCQKQF